MAEINNLILAKLDTILKVLQDIRMGIAEVLDEDLIGASVEEQQPAAKGVA
mgnify:CR=1 FL=1